MTHITPLRLIAAAAILGIAGGGFVGLTFALQGGAIFAAFLTGNLLLGLAALAGTLGVLSLAVEIGLRSWEASRRPGATVLPSAKSFGSGLDERVS